MLPLNAAHVLGQDEAAVQDRGQADRPQLERPVAERGSASGAPHSSPARRAADGRGARCRGGAVPPGLAAVERAGLRRGLARPQSRGRAAQRQVRSRMLPRRWPAMRLMAISWGRESAPARRRSSSRLRDDPARCDELIAPVSSLTTTASGVGLLGDAQRRPGGACRSARGRARFRTAAARTPAAMIAIAAHDHGAVVERRRGA